MNRKIPNIIFKNLALFFLAIVLVLAMEHIFNRLGSDHPVARNPSVMDTLSATVFSGRPDEADSEIAESRDGFNRLIDEKSPYLLQHADNPVDWYPWGEEAFGKARKEDKPIFLSVGYSTCHWCHVMNRESFSDPETAAIMNKYFVNIKLDREERPDVDRTYMMFIQARIGRGGWPMSVWMTPDLKPFFGGTYFPPEDTYNRPGFPSVLRRVANLWQLDKKGLEHEAASITEELRNFVRNKGRHGDPLDSAILEAAVEQIKTTYDSDFGGFGPAPKFPRPSVFNFLHTVAAQPKFDSDLRSSALKMSVETLQEIAKGGIHDHVGGGFSSVFGGQLLSHSALRKCCTIRLSWSSPTSTPTA